MTTETAPVKLTFAREADRVWALCLAKKGFTPEQARTIRILMPALTRMQKILKALT